VKSIRQYLTLSILGASIAISLIGFFSLYLLLRHALIEQMDERLIFQAQSIATECLEDLSKSKPQKIPHELDEMLEDGILSDFFEIRDSSGRFASRSPALGSYDLLPSSTVSHPDKRSLYLPDGQHLRVYYLVARSSNQSVEIAVGASQHELDEALNRALIIILASGSLMIASTVLLFPLLLKRGLQPLSKLGLQLNQKNASNLDSHIAPEAYPSEIHPLIRHFNRLLQRISTSLERERRINADLAHELRTPLAELHLISESATKWPETNTPALILEVLDICRQMEGMVEHMLDLSRSEVGNLRAKAENVDLAPLIHNLWQGLSSKATSRHLQFQVHHEGGDVNTDPELLRMVLSNLLENACSYSDEEGLVRVESICHPNGNFSICISNPASELEASDLEHLFERYWRKHSSRSDTGKHFGLGLSIVKSFCLALNCSLETQLDPNGRLSISIHQKPKTSASNHHEK